MKFCIHFYMEVLKVSTNFELQKIKSSTEDKNTLSTRGFFKIGQDVGFPCLSWIYKTSWWEWFYEVLAHFYPSQNIYKNSDSKDPVKDQREKTEKKKYKAKALKLKGSIKIDFTLTWTTKIRAIVPRS